MGYKKNHFSIEINFYRNKFYDKFSLKYNQNIFLIFSNTYSGGVSTSIKFGVNTKTDKLENHDFLK